MPRPHCIACLLALLPLALLPVTPVAAQDDADPGLDPAAVLIGQWRFDVDASLESLLPDIDNKEMRVHLHESMAQDLGAMIVEFTADEMIATHNGTERSRERYTVTAVDGNVLSIDNERGFWCRVVVLRNRLELTDEQDRTFYLVRDGALPEPAPIDMIELVQGHWIVDEALSLQTREPSDGDTADHHAREDLPPLAPALHAWRLHVDGNRIRLIDPSGEGRLFQADYATDEPRTLRVTLSSAESELTVRYVDADTIRLIRPFGMADTDLIYVRTDVPTVLHGTPAERLIGNWRVDVDRTVREHPRFAAIGQAERTAVATQARHANHQFEWMFRDGTLTVMTPDGRTVVPWELVREEGVQATIAIQWPAGTEEATLTVQADTLHGTIGGKLRWLTRNGFTPRPEQEESPGPGADAADDPRWDEARRLARHIRGAVLGAHLSGEEDLMPGPAIRMVGTLRLDMAAFASLEHFSPADFCLVRIGDDWGVDVRSTRPQGPQGILRIGPDGAEQILSG